MPVEEQQADRAAGEEPAPLEELPVLTARDTVIYPGAMLPVTVGRPSSLALVQSLGENRMLVSYVARAFIGLAGDLEELGVPEGHSERVRLALLDLAHHLDTGSVTWALMRDAVTLVMHYPALGRQALPLLLPYLENAA